MRDLQRTAAALMLLLLVASVPPAASGSSDADIRVDNARVRALLPGQDKTAGYFDVSNHGARPVTLVRAESPDVRAIEFHVTYQDGNMVRMRRLEAVTVAAGETVRFEPGGRHLMMFGVRSQSDITQVRFLTEDGRRLDVEFRLLPAGR